MAWRHGREGVATGKLRRACSMASSLCASSSHPCRAFFFYPDPGSRLTTQPEGKDPRKIENGCEREAGDWTKQSLALELPAGWPLLRHQGPWRLKDSRRAGRRWPRLQIRSETLAVDTRIASRGVAVGGRSAAKEMPVPVWSGLRLMRDGMGRSAGWPFMPPPGAATRCLARTPDWHPLALTVSRPGQGW